MAFISSAKKSSGNEEVNTASIPTASTYVSPTSANIGAVSISQDTACTYIASQSNGSQIKFEDIAQIDEDDMEEMDIKLNMALLSMRADRFWKRTGQKISIQGNDVVRFDKSKVECFNCPKMGHFARECRALKSQDMGRRDNYRQGSKVEEQAPKALMAIDGVGWDWSFMENEEENHALVADEEALTEFALMAKTSAECEGNFQNHIDDKGYWDSGCSRHMTGNISYLSDYEPFDGGYVSFGQGGCKITSKGTIKTGKLEFKNVYFVKDLKYNLFSMSQICDNKNSVLFTDLECIVLGRDFKLIDDTNVLLRTPRQHNMYSIDMNNIVPHKDLTCLVAQESADECMLWHRRLGKQHKAFCKTKLVNSMTKPLHTLHMYLFGPTSAIEKGTGPNWLFDIDSLTKSINYVLVVVAGYIALPNWVHEALLESSSTNAQDTCNADAPESSRNLNPTDTTTNLSANQMETLTVETPIPTVSSSVPTACLNDSPEPSSDTRLFSKRVTSQDDMPSLDNILTMTNRFEDILGVTTNTDDTNGVEADLGNMETTITARVRPIGTKWVLKNKKDERGIVIRNKARLVAQRHTQEEGIDYDEVFAPAVRIEAIRLFLAYASFMGFIVYHMDVKSAFLYGTIDEEVGTIDQTLFIRMHREDFILVQVYVDDIIFRLLNPQLCREFEALMHEKFQMSAMGELNFNLGLLSMPCEALSKEISSSILLFGFCRGIPYKVRVDFQPTVYVSHIRQFWSTAWIETTEEGTKVLATVDGKLRTVSESSIRRNLKLNDEAGISTPTKPHHTPSPEAQQTLPTTHSSSSLLPVPTEPLPTVTPSDTPQLSDSTPRVTSLATDEGSMQHQIQELTALRTSLQRVKLLEDKEGGGIAQSGDDALIKGKSLDEGEEAARKGSDGTTEMVIVLTSLDATTALSSEVDEVPTGSGSIPTAGPLATETTPYTIRKGKEKMVESDIPKKKKLQEQIDVQSNFYHRYRDYPYTRRKGKEKMVESDIPKKKKLQEQIDVQVAKELEEEMARDAQRMNEQIARDAEIARIHTEDELQMMIDGLDKNNETVAKYLQEYHHFAAELPIGRRIELISDLVKYQDNYAKVLKFQTQ
nr:putative ribonuclease H-like domain-containing protein [Tanacetum cinerariifolium]